MLSLKAGKIVVLGATCGFLAAAIQVSVLIGARQAELAPAARCDACLATSQVEIEFARLEQRIAAALVPGTAVGPADVRLRFDALATRAAALDLPAIRTVLDQDTAAAATRERLAGALRALGPDIARIDQPGIGEAALAALAPLDFDLSRLSAAADRAGLARAAAAEAELARLHRILTAVLACLFALGAVLLALLGWHNRQLGLARDGQQRSSEKLRAASARLAAATAEVSTVNAQLQARNAVLDRRDRELGLQNQRFDAALNNMAVALCMVDGNDRLVVYNRRFAELFGLALAPIPGLLFADLLGMATGPQLEQVHARQRALSAEAGDTNFVQEIAPPAAAPHEGGPRTVSVSHRPMRDGGWLATYEDVTERRQAESRIAFLARHDPLTGLCNRAFFAEQLDAVLAEARRRGTPLAVIALDVDGFKDVNEGHGPAAGDALLREVGRRIVRAAGDGVVARLGGDEFAVIALGAAAPGALATRLAEAVGGPFAAGGAALAPTVSVGYASWPADASSAEALTRHAESALAAAKGAGGGAVRAFAPDRDAARRARRALEADLRQALPNREFTLAFQPLVDTRRVAITGFEALLRWHHPGRGAVSPADFVPLAEEIGLIGEIGNWVLGEACAQAARWPGDFTVAVNLSPAQFGLMDVVSSADEALARSGLGAARLELEITETVLLDDGEHMLEILHALRARGIRIAMDDFGTGHSSLSYLRRFPFDKIKIDQSFVRDMATRPDCITIVRSMAALGASLGMTTTAEGVETPEQFAQLQAAGCDQAQGYLFGRPQPPAQMSFALGADWASRGVAAA